MSPAPVAVAVQLWGPASSSLSSPQPYPSTSNSLWLLATAAFAAMSGEAVASAGARRTRPWRRLRRVNTLGVHAECVVFGLMSFSHMVLGLLEPAPRHGFALKTEYDSRFGRSRPLAVGQVYATLARLKRDGLAELVGVESGEGPDRRVYAVTSRGVEELSSWLLTPEPPTAYQQSVLFAKTVLALLSGRPATDILDAQREVHLQRMREARRAAQEGDLISRLAADHEIAHLDADLRWMELAGQRLDAVLQEQGVSG